MNGKIQSKLDVLDAVVGSWLLIHILTWGFGGGVLGGNVVEMIPWHLIGIRWFFSGLFNGGNENGLDLLPADQHGKDVHQVRIVWIRTAMVSIILSHKLDSLILGIEAGDPIGKVLHCFQPFFRILEEQQRGRVSVVGQ